MKAIILGYGKMGHLIHELLSLDSTNTVLAILENKQITNKTKQANFSFPIFNDIKTIDKALIEETDVIFDFIGANSETVLKYLVSNFKNLKIISGSTAWNPQKIYSLIEKNKHSFLYSSNFSIGINIMQNILNTLLSNMDISSFDSNLIEYHHKEKKDAPSGTALSLKSIFDQNGINLPISSVRSGSYPGIHKIDFDGKYENLSITHTARDRKVFAEGAIYAAKYLFSKGAGIYNFQDVLANKIRK